MVTAPDRRELVRFMIGKGLSERRALILIQMSASSLRYQPAPDRNEALRADIIALAHRHRRYGAEMIHLKLRQRGQLVNHKRVDRLYRLEELQLRKRKRKKVPLGERQPLLRPTQANDTWSMDFVFDRSADTRVIKCLTVIDDATNESVAIVPERAIGGKALTRILDSICRERGYPQIIRTDNGKELCGKDMLIWCHENGVKLRLIEPGKPNQNAYIESFNGRFRDECLNENWFMNLAHAKVIIEAWRREYNEERPKKALGGLTPAAYAKQLAMKAVNIHPGL